MDEQMARKNRENTREIFPKNFGQKFLLSRHFFCCPGREQITVGQRQTQAGMSPWFLRFPF